MGALRRITGFFLRESKGKRLRRAAAEYNGVAPSKLTDDQLKMFMKTEAAGELADASVSATQAMARSAAAAVGVTATAAGGAYAYGEYTDQQRYEEYQNRVDRINARYEAGEITKERRDELLAQARDDYRHKDNPNAGLSLTELLAQMDSIQLALLAGVSTVALVIFGPSVAEAASNFSAKDIFQN